jgi:hypothetical protein
LKKRSRKKKQPHHFECSVLKHQVESRRGFAPPKRKWDALSEEGPLETVLRGSVALKMSLEEPARRGKEVM